MESAYWCDSTLDFEPLEFPFPICLRTTHGPNWKSSCWKPHDALIIFNLTDIYKWFRLSLHNQTNMYAARALSPHIWHCCTCLQRDVQWCGFFFFFFFLIKRELWVGVNRSVVIESLNQVNKPWLNKEAWYILSRFRHSQSFLFLMCNSDLAAKSKFSRWTIVELAKS